MKVNGKMVKQYNALGYNVKQYDTIELNVQHLNKYSHQKILCACDICSEQKMVKYNNYYKYIITNGLYTCNKCNLEKRKNTCIEKYGFDFVAKSDYSKKKSKETIFNNHGDENYNNRKQANETCMRKYGVENVSQDPEIHKKQQSGYVLKYHNTGLYYRGSYEKDFLDYCVINTISVINYTNTFKYFFENKERRYHTDFFIQKLNLIVEIKSSWTYECELEQNLAKKEAVISNGFNFIFIIDKNYKELETLLNQSSSESTVKKSSADCAPIPEIGLSGSSISSKSSFIS
jgi:hypothetical protein